MGRWELIGEAEVPGSPHPLTLYRNADEFVIRVGHIVLMTSRMHGSEDVLADVACERLADRKKPRILIGGLGMGFTLAAALRGTGPGSEVVVADVVAEVVEWNRGPLGEAAGRPLDDPRTTVYVGDVADAMRAEPGGFDAILIDIDNGPDGLSRMGNERLYGTPGLREAHAALKPKGILGVWSVGREPAFTRRMHAAGFKVDEVVARGHGQRGARHVIWFGERLEAWPPNRSATPSRGASGRGKTRSPRSSRRRT